MTNPPQMWTYWDGEWRHGEFLVAGPRTHGLIFGTSVFDGARWLDGVMPDLDAHCLRTNRSAEALGLRPTMTAQQIESLAREGAARFSGTAPLYIRPTYWAESGGSMTIDADPASTRFCLSIYEAPLPTMGSSLGISPFRRPSRETMPTDAKSGCLYPNNARAVLEAQSRGFGNALLLDMLGNVAETATTNVFMVKNGAVCTPIPNGTFLNGITRQRVIGLLRNERITVIEKTLSVAEILAADEVFTTGNFAKVLPINRIEKRDYPPGPITHLAREAYFAWARSQT